jgi:TolB-like protein/class 3 adenylate cyclase
MAEELQPDPQVKIAHVLTMDVVQYSTLLIDEQTRVMTELALAVAKTERFRRADAAGELLRIPTGDGMALIFFGDPQAALECGMETAAALKAHPQIRVRMGIHSGPVKEVSDVSGRRNVAGAGIDIAQRVMDCGDAGHILLSKRVADDLAPFPRWNPYLHDLGEHEVKHGRKVSLVNFVTPEVGNAEPPLCLARAHEAKSATRPSSGAIAVLPLQNLSGEPAEEYFADGMTEALITDLAKIGLKVISRASIIGFKGTKRPLTEIARELGVEAIVEGSVLRDHDRVRISARLVHVPTNEYLWADRYDRELSDVLSLQDEVARAVAGAIGQKLRAPTGPRPRKIDRGAYLLDLQARHLWHQRTEASFRAALQLFEDAVARDPTYAPAHVGIAEALSMLSNYGLVSPREIRGRAEAAVKCALALDQESADAHRLLAFFHWQFDFAWEKAIAEYERAIAINPHSATNYWYGAYLGVIGFFKKSHEMLERAHELDPLSLVVPSVQGWIRIFARQFEQAVPYCRQVLEIDPRFHMAYWFLGEALVELGQHEEGIRALEQAYHLAGQTSRLLGYLGYAYGRGERKSEAHECLAQLEERAKTVYVPPYFEALVLSGLDERERAIDQLECSYRDGDTMLRDLKADPHWDRLRSHPRFAALMQQMAYPRVPAEEQIVGR